VTVETELRGIRIDSFLAKHLRNYTSWRLARMVRIGCASINGVSIDETRRVFSGERVTIRLTEPPDKLMRGETRELPILYEDPWLIVVDKPADLIAHPTGHRQSGTLANIMQAYLDTRTSLRGLLRPGIVHRLDRQTSGLMVIASHHLSHRNLAAGFEAGRVSKTYLALCEGIVKKDSDIINLPIGRARTGRQILMSARGDAVAARSAKTAYHVVERFAEHTLVRCKPTTGRNHQIRVHLAQIGHPLIGDEFYMAHGQIRPLKPPLGEDPTAADLDETFSDDWASYLNTGLPIRRHALHASQLEFAHPITDIWTRFESRLPDDFQQTVNLLRS